MNTFLKILLVVFVCWIASCKKKDDVDYKPVGINKWEVDSLIEITEFNFSYIRYPYIINSEEKIRFFCSKIEVSKNTQTIEISARGLQYPYSWTVHISIPLDAMIGNEYTKGIRYTDEWTHFGETCGLGSTKILITNRNRNYLFGNFEATLFGGVTGSTSNTCQYSLQLLDGHFMVKLE